MIQDIGKNRYKCEFVKEYPRLTDILIYMNGRSLLMKRADGCLAFPTFADTNIAGCFDKNGTADEHKWRTAVVSSYPDIEFYRTIAIDDTAYYIVDTDKIFDGTNGLEPVESGFLRHYMPAEAAFGAVTALQIARWRRNNAYCGRCGGVMRPSESERAMECGKCGNTVYPKICPAVTISIIHDDKILLVRNRVGAFHKYAQVAGYVEIGETFEDAVRREAMEETGLELGEISYYKNQPWAMTDAQMIGYTAYADSTAVRLQREELLEARWFAADEIPPNLADRSLTYEMMGNFRRKYIQKTGETGRWKEFYGLFDIKEPAEI